MQVEISRVWDKRSHMGFTPPSTKYSRLLLKAIGVTIGSFVAVYAAMVLGLKLGWDVRGFATFLDTYLPDPNGWFMLGFQVLFCSVVVGQMLRYFTYYASVLAYEQHLLKVNPDVTTVSVPQLRVSETEMVTYPSTLQAKKKGWLGLGIPSRTLELSKVHAVVFHATGRGNYTWRIRRVSFRDKVIPPLWLTWWDRSVGINSLTFTKEDVEQLTEALRERHISVFTEENPRKKYL